MSEYIEDLQKLLYKPVRKYIPLEVYFKWKIEFYVFDDCNLYAGKFLVFLSNDDELRIWLNDKLRNYPEIYILSLEDLSKRKVDLNG